MTLRPWAAVVLFALACTALVLGAQRPQPSSCGLISPVGRAHG